MMMLSLFQVIVVWHMYTFSASLSNIDCIIIESAASAPSDDSQISVSCSISQYPIMTSCGCRTSDNSYNAALDGCWTDTTVDICYAQNGYISGGGTGVYAIARCCKFPSSDVDCMALNTDYAQNIDGTRTTTCSTTSYQYMTGCSAYSPWAAIDGSYPALTEPASGANPGTDYEMDGYCTARNGANGAGTRAEVVCCNSPTYDLQCVVRYGSPITTATQISIAYCDSGYTMVGCSAFGDFRNVNAWYIDSNGLCNARGYTNDAVQAIGICCKQETGSPTYNPTPSPTNNPTASPINNPTPSPTNNPISPTNNPISSPTNNPTASPINNPTASPINNPISSPTNNPASPPTNNPTPSPVNNPTASPTNNPTASSTNNPIPSPTNNPTLLPTNNPTPSPTNNPTPSPTNNPIPPPTNNPASPPTNNPTASSTNNPTSSPINNPTASPTNNPASPSTNNPIPSPTNNPASPPTNNPTLSPTNNPTTTADPTQPPTVPTKNPTQSPVPIATPTKHPTSNPTTSSITTNPTSTPTDYPISNPSVPPTNNPSINLTQNPTFSPTRTTSYPSSSPSNTDQSTSTAPTLYPSHAPSQNVKLPTTSVPTSGPTKSPTNYPTTTPNINTITKNPTFTPTPSPTDITTIPTGSPRESAQTYTPTTREPTKYPVWSPTTATGLPSKAPTQVSTPKWKNCIEEFALFDNDATGAISIEVDLERKKMRITLRGLSGKWWGIGFGSHFMLNTYAITVSGDRNNIITEQRILGNHTSGKNISDTFDEVNSADIGNNRIVSMVSNWKVIGYHDIYDFTDFFECKIRLLPIIWARGTGVKFTFHSNFKGASKKLMSCNCDPTNAPTPIPTYLPTNIPSTAKPTNLPTLSVDEGNNANHIHVLFEILFICFVVVFAC